MQRGRNGISGSVCDGEAGGPENGVRGGGSELIEVNLTVRVDGETGVRIGVVRGASAVDGANRCETLGMSVSDVFVFGSEECNSSFLVVSSASRVGVGR